ncbi:AP-1 complex subunit sigma-2-like [Hibiscus syriacus]|uniref:AP-1 complex subunit sigma-2-like n=1 Tax=Hibiscus syriacus TaxID=106335 RepID=UPI0019220BDD|nr:AP-1 complex subunit sigma-2-like [Hibiscus syriacus]
MHSEKVIRELGGVILSRGPKLCNFLDWRGFKVFYKRYAGIYFCICIDQDDNEIKVLEIIHHFVEILDRYFGSVCGLDLIFKFHKQQLSSNSRTTPFFSFFNITPSARKQQENQKNKEPQQISSVILCLTVCGSSATDSSLQDPRFDPFSNY